VTRNLLIINILMFVGFLLNQEKMTTAFAHTLITSKRI
jgi:hypothetical protein